MKYHLDSQLRGYLLGLFLCSQLHLLHILISSYIPPIFLVMTMLIHRSAGLLMLQGMQMVVLALIRSIPPIAPPAHIDFNLCPSRQCCHVSGNGLIHRSANLLLLQGMQMVVLALIRSIPPIASVAMFGLFEFIVFAIIGMQLFSGRLGACNQVVSILSQESYCKTPHCVSHLLVHTCVCTVHMEKFSHHRNPAIACSNLPLTCYCCILCSSWVKPALLCLVCCLMCRPVFKHVQEIDGVPVQYKSQCLQGISFVCNGTQDNNCDDGDVTIREWQVAFYNFDNMGAALLSVVEVGVMDNYMDDVAYQLMDAVGEERAFLLPAVIQPCDIRERVQL